MTSILNSFILPIIVPVITGVAVNFFNSRHFVCCVLLFVVKM